EDGRVLVDASKFYLRDAHNVIARIKRMNQGNYKLDQSRSAFYLPRTKNFPKNTEIDVTLTFTGSSPGNFVRQVVPSPDIITVRQHHSFIELPDADYQPRRFDPRAGFFGISYMDFATPIHEPIRQRFIARHQLKKKNPTASMSEAVEPIIYYLDPGAPEPIRSALLEGALWWNQAFEAAGYKDAFQVKMLPEDADAMDVRYNVIQWVHRSTRGWSYGSTVMDPRTGEIIKGHVTLGSLRVRQDFLIAEGLLAPYEDGQPFSPAMQEMALARLRQLSAHEVGHTLGLAHNFAASVSNRASVMDYPHPYIKIQNKNTLDLSGAYDTGIGEWDKVAIAYGYQDFGPGAEEKSELNDILRQSMSEGLIFITDQDARPAGGAHPLAHLWDNSTDAIAELDRIMKVRDLALRNFSEKNIRHGAPMAKLEEVLVPIYMFHRYQVDAASKLLGGMYYTYAVRGDGQKVTEMIPPDRQRQALSALLATLKPEVLALSEDVLRTIPPRAYGYNRSRETFNIRTRLTFDPLAAAETAASMTVDFILHPERAARLVEFHSRNKDYPGFNEVVEALLATSWQRDRGTDHLAEIQRVVDNVVLYNLMSLSADKSASNQVRAIASMGLVNLDTWLSSEMPNTQDPDQRAHIYFALSQMRRFHNHPEGMNYTNPADPPAGPPIGMEDASTIEIRCDLN
ncbi:zinc-dependent metalloprotease, partial [bacterium]|nr:zinc-dependent metalloprotease [bacterium]